MTQDELLEMLDEQKTHILDFQGKCHSCQSEIIVSAGVETFDGQDMLFIHGGGICKVEEYNSEEKYDKILLICPDCYETDKYLKNWKRCEVFSRIVGYMRPVDSWNKAKQHEFDMRKTFEKSI
jgi:hypothetical protein